MNPKIIQIIAWRDMLLGLTDTGEIYRLTWWDEGRAHEAHFVADGAPVFPGLMVRRRGPGPR